jgi:hypothetical protein
MNQQLLQKAGMPANQNTCASHMLMDERVIPLLVKVAEKFLQVKDQQDLTIRKHLVHLILVHYTSKLLSNTGHGKENTSINSPKGPLLKI